MTNYNTLILIGFVVVIVGILIIFIGSALQSSSNSPKTEIQTGGVIMIGPIPIIFGNDNGLVSLAVIFAIVLMIIYFVLFYKGTSL